MNESYVHYEIKDNVGYIEFFNQNHNALPSEILTKLTEVITNAGDDKRAKVLVLKSGGIKTFCAGASFNELVQIEDPDSGLKFFTGFANVINAMRKCPKLIVGRIQGKAIGGGVGLAAATDYCMASSTAEIKLSELNIGIGPFVVSPVIERKIGVAATSQIAIDCNTFYDAEWAKSRGLYAQVFISIEELDSGIDTFTQKLIKYHPEAMKRMKEIFWEDYKHWDDLLLSRAKISGELVLSSFTKDVLKSYQISNVK